MASLTFQNVDIDFFSQYAILGLICQGVHPLQGMEEPGKEEDQDEKDIGMLIRDSDY